ncbi:hypothetical protein [Hymenobacter terrenus]|uniref:hypothetical protein n=1 Tax=Hymenobacter terrenus TaxID=1629124 RepID=UPI0006961E77|nr:hypothetical protein [Hymenobacter terrenus]
MPTAQAFSVANEVNHPIPDGYNVARIREDFPALHQQVNGQPLIYFDTAASCHKPCILVERI